MAVPASSTPHILLLRLSSLGDLVLATAALGPLARAGCRVSLVTKAEFAPLFRGQPGLEEVFAFDKKKLAFSQATHSLLRRRIGWVHGSCRF